VDFSFIHQHPTISTVIGYYIFSSVVGGMPPPFPTSSSGYKWLYNSLHLLAGNISEAFKKKYPDLPQGSTVKEETRTTISSPNAETQP
jgi:hypothetical protein